jgi:hypothetical protein
VASKIAGILHPFRLFASFVVQTERRTLFDKNGNALPALKEFRRVAYYPQYTPAAFGGPK